MIPRLRMLAGPNGSGKSTLAQQLVDDYAVNLYKFLNADMLFAEIAQSDMTRQMKQLLSVNVQQL